MRLRPLAIIALLAALLTSCSPTKYVPAKSTSDFGFVEIPIDDNTFRISFHGNMYTDFETVDRYALFRAAELTDSKGFDYFIIAESANGGTTMGGVSTTPGVGTSGSTGTEHTASKTIKLYKGAKPPDLASAYDAKAVIRNMGPYIRRPGKK